VTTKWKLLLQLPLLLAAVDGILTVKGWGFTGFMFGVLAVTVQFIFMEEYKRA
jgi:hypothetical protein